MISIRVYLSFQVQKKVSAVKEVLNPKVVMKVSSRITRRKKAQFKLLDLDFFQNQFANVAKDCLPLRVHYVLTKQTLTVEESVVQSEDSFTRLRMDLVNMVYTADVAGCHCPAASLVGANLVGILINTIYEVDISI